MEVNGISLYVEDHGEGVPVLMIHGWPDSARLWRHQVPHLVGRGYRVITPDLRGFGRSGRPEDVAAYRLRNSAGPAAARAAAAVAAGHRADHGRVVHRGPLPGRRDDAEFGFYGGGAVAV